MWREKGKNSILRQKCESKHVKKRTSQNTMPIKILSLCAWRSALVKTPHP